MAPTTPAKQTGPPVSTAMNGRFKSSHSVFCLYGGTDCLVYECECQIPFRDLDTEPYINKGCTMHSLVLEGNIS